jgi:HK97 family phage portal protein
MPQRGGRERRYLDGGIGRGASFVPSPGTEIGFDYVGDYRSMASSTVFACVRLLADTVASLPWKVYRRDSYGIPVELDPQPKLLRQPYPGFDLFQWKQMVVHSLCLRGNSYHMVLSRDTLGYPQSVLPLHPDMVYLERKANIVEWMNPTYRVMGEQIAARDIIHIRRFTMPGNPEGLSPIRQAAIGIGLGLAAEEYGYRYFKDSANPSAVVSTKENLDDDAITRNQKNWIASHGGRRRPAFLSGGFEYKAISISPNESQFLETRKFQRSEISMMFGIPPHMIGDVEKETSWGTGIEQQSIGFVTYTLRPWLACIEQVFSDQLPGGQFVRFDVNALLRGDVKARSEYYKNMVQISAFSPDDVRLLEEMEPVPDGKGKQHLQPVNYAPLGFDPAEIEKQKAAARPVTPTGSRPPGQDEPQPGTKEGDGNGQGGNAPQSGKDSGRPGTARNGHAVRTP